LRWSPPRDPLARDRFPVAETRQGHGLGAILLADAVRRAYTTSGTVGSSILVVDAISERAAAFYKGNGFLRPPESLRLVLPMHAIERLLQP
jgi:GNAT superfamily N-acetyltransferase